MSSIVDTQFRLSATAFAVSVDVRLRSRADRWIAVAEVGAGSQVGLGRTAREALSAALRSYREEVRRALLADLALLAPSIEIMEAAGASQRR